MEQNFDVQIICEDYIDTILLEEIKAKISKSNLLLVFEKKHKEQFTINNFNGDYIPDIIITVIASEELIKSVIGSGFYDVIKFSVLKLVEQLKNIKDKENTKIEINHHVTKNKSVLKFTLSGDLNTEDISKLMDKYAEISKSVNQQKTLLKDEKLIDRANNIDRIHMSPNQDHNDWNPLNIIEHNKNIQELFDKIRKEAGNQKK